MTETTNNEQRAASEQETARRHPWFLFTGIVASIVLLALGEGLQDEHSWILKLPSQWLALAVLPLLIGLVTGGYISKISFGGATLEGPGYIKGLKRVEQESGPEHLSEPGAGRAKKLIERVRRKRQLPLDEPPGWAKPAKGINGHGEFLTLVHSYEPSKHSGQKYDVSIYIMKHLPGPGNPNQTNQFEEIERAEFFFGPSWGNQVFHAENKDGVIGINTSAWGMFFASCRVFFKEGKEPLVLYRYIDFQMGPK
jgi:hypothetical protein